MGVRSILLPWDIQPQDVAGINWDHPRARGLCLFVPGGNALGFRDLVRDQPLTLTGLTTQAITSQGPTKLFGDSSYADFVRPPEIGANTPFTLAWTQQPISPVGYAATFVFNFGTAGVHYQFLVYCGVASDVYRFSFGPRRSNGGNSYETSVGALTDGRLDRFVIVAKAGSQSLTASDFDLYRNGELMTRNATATYGPSTDAIARIGARELNSDRFEGAILDVRLWSRALTGDEAAVESHVNGAVELYEPDQVQVPVASAAGGYTLTAAAGSFTLTGSAAGLKAGRRVTAAAGSFTLTGNAAGLYRGLRLSAAAGTYAWTGNAANLLAQRKLLAAAGSYALTGNAAVLRAGRMLAMASGSYTFTGQAAGLSKTGSYSLAADAGSYAFNGQNVALLAGRKLVAGAGSFALTGQAATLRVSRRLAADVGSFALSGQDLALRAARRLSAGTGVFNLTGSAAQLLRGYHLAATAGTYAFTGNAAVLAKTGSYSLTAGAGAYAWTGIGATLTYSGEIFTDSEFWKYTVPAQPLLFTVPAQDLRFTVPADPLAFTI